MIDIEKMKQAALAATQGEWVVSDHIYASDGKRVASHHMISRDDCENEANATHIATANPAAVIELIERLKLKHETYVKMLGELLAVAIEDAVLAKLREENLAQAAQIEIMRIALSEVSDLIGESQGVYGFHLNGDVSPWPELEVGGRFEQLCTLPEAISITPSQALEQFAEKVREQCAKVADHYTKASYLGKVGEAIRNIKELP